MLGIIFVTAIGAIFAVTINTYTGVKNIDPHFIEAARNMGAKGSQLITAVLIPAAFPYMISGFKQGMGICLERSNWCRTAIFLPWIRLLAKCWTFS